MSELSENIIRLRNEGKTYNEIKEITNASLSTISYHCGDGQKVKTRVRSESNSDFMWTRLSKFRPRKYEPKGRIITGDITRLGYWKARDFQRRLFGNKGLLKASDTVKAFNYNDVVEVYGDETHCYLTGRAIKLSEPTTYNFDHIIPVSKGGDNSIGNLGIASVDVNYAKGNLSVEEFVLLCKEVVDYYSEK